MENYKIQKEKQDQLIQAAKSRLNGQGISNSVDGTFLLLNHIVTLLERQNELLERKHLTFWQRLFGR